MVPEPEAEDATIMIVIFLEQTLGKQLSTDFIGGWRKMFVRYLLMLVPIVSTSIHSKDNKFICYLVHAVLTR